MFGFFKKKEQKIIAEQDKTISVLKDALNETQEQIRFAEKCSEESIESHIMNLEKIKGILEGTTQWKQKQTELNNYVDMALEVLKGKKD